MMNPENPIEITSGATLNPIRKASSMDYDSLDRDEQIKDRRADRDHRASLICWVKWNVSGWLICVIAILACCGFGWMKLSTEVLDVLLATTTVNILGLAFIVLKGLFK